jgi:hypothetical protein
VDQLVIFSNILAPDFWASLAAFVTAIAALITVLKNRSTVESTHQTVQAMHQTVLAQSPKLDTVVTQTNGVAAALQERIDVLEQTLLEMRELKLTPRTVPLPGGRRVSDHP